MLKKFLLNALSAFVGAWAAIALFIVGIVVLILGVIGTLAAGSVERLERHSVMHLSLSGQIAETETNPQLDYTFLLNGSLEKPQTLKTILLALEKAKQNNNIEALYIECSGADASPATLNALRNAILDFKKCGKRVFAYGDSFTMGDYFVATAADEIYLNPEGSLNLQGISGTSLYFKDFLDKVGIDVETVRVGSFKSAIEPFTQNEMSEPARAQLDTLYTEMWIFILDDMAKATGKNAETIDSLVNHFIFLDKATEAKKYNLVTDCLYYRQVLSKIGDYVGEDPLDVNMVSPETVAGNLPENPNAKNQIAVLYAVGEIEEYSNNGINCHNLVPVIVKLAEDDNVKGMVLRVNSPGGSVFGSAQIGEALDYFKSKGKPLAVSMGSYAASGGYWISAGGDVIFADPLTITGSIGIFGMVPNVSPLANKLGVHPQTVSTNPGVMFPSIFYPMGEDQRNALQANVERGYEQFVDRVAKGRKKSVEYIKSIAEGRVWSGMKAKELGLVDQLGGLNDAIDWVRNKVEENNCNIVNYPIVEPSLISMLSSSSIEVSSELQGIINNLKKQNIEEKLISFAEWFLMQEHLQARCNYYHISL